MKKELKDLTIAVGGFILIEGLGILAIMLLDGLDGKIYSATIKAITTTMAACLCGLCYYVYSVIKSLFNLKIKKHSCKHLETILHSGCKTLGKEEVQQLYDIAFGDNDVAIEWMNENQEIRNKLNKKILYYDLSQSEKAELKEKYDVINKRSDIVFYLRFYKRQSYEVDEIYNKILNQY